MPRVHMVEWEDASPEVREIYKEIEDTTKERVTKSLKACANNIHVLRARWENHKRLLYTETYLPFKMKKAIQLVVAKAMGCQA
jgi:hypothetical protein